jgi:hypothetical protein
MPVQGQAFFWHCNFLPVSNLPNGRVFQSKIICSVKRRQTFILVQSLETGLRGVRSLVQALHLQLDQ